MELTEKKVAQLIRRRRKNASYRLRPALELKVQEYLHEVFGRKNAKLRHVKRVTNTGDITEGVGPDEVYLGEAVGETYEAEIDRRYESEFLVDPDSPEGRRKLRKRRLSRKAAFRPLSSRSDKDFVDAILAGCLRAWIYRERGAPSELSVAEAIAARLGVEDESRFRVGGELMALAVSAGLVKPAKQPRGKNRWVNVLRLTDEAAALLCDLESKEEWPWPATGIHAQPITGQIETRRGKRQSDTPYKPGPGTAPLIAAHRIRETKWRISDDMVPTAQEWLQRELDVARAKPGMTWWKVANDYRSEIAAVQSLRSCARQGWLAVRYEHRGRVNQIDSLVTYTGGCEPARGVLEFDEARIVETQAGREALARHVLNQWSSAESRAVPRRREIDWLEAHPGFDWKRARHPLRFAAALRAWHAAQAGDPIRLPVSIDATTSVLQHMALLLRDPQLAQLSNLWPNERQRDFYSEVAEAAELSDKLPDDLKSKARDIVKPIVMPSFYGKGEWTSNYDLARLKIPKAVRAQIYPDMMEAARRLAPEAFKLYETLKLVAQELALRGEPITWRTTSHWEGCTARLEQIDRDFDIELKGRVGRWRPTRKVNGKLLNWSDQMSAITANLVHSQDATLLHLAVRALPARITSIAVAHDCFATHADDVPVLRETLMQTLGQMYADDVLGGWWAAWNTSVPCPKVGEWDPRFLQGEYAFS